MNTSATPLPLPADPRHQRVADLHLAGMPLAEAAAKAGLGKSKGSSRVLGSRVWRRADVKRYVAAVRQAAATATTLTLIEKREFLARIVRTPITRLDPEQEADADLIKSYRTSTTDLGSSMSLEKLDPLAAIKIDNELAGEDPASQTMRELAAALSSLAVRSPLPTGKL